ncbi:MAG TPA: GNAT family N-acetyltransferase [Candidatus Nanoarchaeia archaeon]|nr:GNAT family N-acetyltransferase [Candidatus Nanoarchaeia archaeon]
MIDITVRNATNKDYLFCYNLHKKSMLGFVKKHWGVWDPKVFRKNFNIEETRIILSKTKRIGFYAVKLRQGCYYLNDIQISTSMQGKGIGTKIMNSIEKQALKLGKNKVQLTVFKDNPAKQLFEKLGYRTVNDRGDSLSMGKIIK